MHKTGTKASSKSLTSADAAVSADTSTDLVTRTEFAALYEAVMKLSKKMDAVVAGPGDGPRSGDGASTAESGSRSSSSSSTSASSSSSFSSVPSSIPSLSGTGESGAPSGHLIYGTGDIRPGLLAAASRYASETSEKARRKGIFQYLRQVLRPDVLAGFRKDYRREVIDTVTGKPIVLRKYEAFLFAVNELKSVLDSHYQPTAFTTLLQVLKDVMVAAKLSVPSEYMTFPEFSPVAYAQMAIEFEECGTLTEVVSPLTRVSASMGDTLFTYPESLNAIKRRCASLDGAFENVTEADVVRQAVFDLVRGVPETAWPAIRRLLPDRNLPACPVTGWVQNRYKTYNDVFEAWFRESDWTGPLAPQLKAALRPAKSSLALVAKVGGYITCINCGSRDGHVATECTQPCGYCLHPRYHVSCPGRAARFKEARVARHPERRTESTGTAVTGPKEVRREGAAPSTPIKGRSLSRSISARSQLTSSLSEQAQSSPMSSSPPSAILQKTSTSVDRSPAEASQWLVYCNVSMRENGMNKHNIILDSGASYSILGEVTGVDMSECRWMGTHATVVTADGTRVPATGQGVWNICLGDYTYSLPFLYVPEIPYNLISVAGLVDATKGAVQFSGEGAFLIQRGKSVPIARRSGSMYELTVGTASVHQSQTTGHAECHTLAVQILGSEGDEDSEVDDYDGWDSEDDEDIHAGTPARSTSEPLHTPRSQVPDNPGDKEVGSTATAPFTELHARLGHAGERKIRRLYANNLIRGLPCLAAGKYRNCIECDKANYRARHGRLTDMERARNKLDRLHADLVGPITVDGYKRWVLVIVDEYTRMRFVYILGSKGKLVADTFNRFLDEAERTAHSRCVRVRTDKGTEFHFLSGSKVIHELADTQSHQSVGIVERSNGLLFSKLRAELEASRLPVQLWPEVLEAVTYRLNATTIVRLQDGRETTAFEAFTGYTPSYDHLLPTGTLVVCGEVHLGDKLVGRGFSAILIGRTGDKWKVWSPHHMDVFETSHFTVRPEHWSVEFPDIAQLDPRRVLSPTPAQLLEDIQRVQLQRKLDMAYTEVHSEAPPPVDPIPETSSSTSCHIRQVISPRTLEGSKKGARKPAKAKKQAVLAGSEQASSSSSQTSALDDSRSHDGGQSELSSPAGVGESPPGAQHMVTSDASGMSVRDSALTLPTLGMPTSQSLPQTVDGGMVESGENDMHDIPLGRNPQPQHPYNTRLRALAQRQMEQPRQGPDSQETEERALSTEAEISEMRTLVAQVEAEGVLFNECMHACGAEVGEYLVMVATTISLPRSYRPGMQHPRQEEIDAAVTKELTNMKDTGTLIEVEPWEVEGHDPISMIILLNEKDTVDGPIVKARAVVNGKQQKVTEDHATYAPVLSRLGCRFLFHVGALLGWHMLQVDVDAAFLHGKYPDGAPPVYVKAHMAFRTLGISQARYFRVGNGIYGLVAAPRIWHATLAEYLREQGFESWVSERCIFQKRFPDGSVALVGVYVDDVIITASTKATAEAVQDLLASRFPIKKMGPPRRFLGMDVKYDQEERTCLLDCKWQVSRAMSKFGITPQHESAPLRRDYETRWACSDITSTSTETRMAPLAPNDADLFSQIVGALNYIAGATRPDVAYAASLLSSKLSSPTTADLSAAICALRYVESNPKPLVMGRGGVRDRIVVYADASLMSEPDTASRTGLVLHWGQAPLSWSSRIQDTLASSTLSAEIRALYDGYGLGTALRCLVDDLWEFLGITFPEMEPTQHILMKPIKGGGMQTLRGDLNLPLCYEKSLLLLTDNLPAVMTIHELRKIPKPMPRREYNRFKALIKAMRNDGTLVAHVESKDNLANVLTKRTGATELRNAMMRLVSNVGYGI